MSVAELEGIWERLQGGRHAAVVGLALPTAPAQLRLIRVSCDVPPSTLGPLHDARRRLEATLGEAPILDQARDRLLGSLRRRLLGESPAPEIDAILVELGNRLADLTERRAILVFEAVEAADAPTLAILRQIVLRPGWMRLPILLHFRDDEPEGTAGTLLAALACEGSVVVIRGAQASAAAVGADSLRDLDPESLAVLRAGALIGTGFEVDLCAALLEVPPLAVLLRVQAAVDRGVPLEDRGEGRIHMPPPLVAVLRAGTTPSLARHWHRRLAALLGGGDTGVAAAVPQARDSVLLAAAESASLGGPTAAMPRDDAAPPAAEEPAADRVSDEVPLADAASGARGAEPPAEDAAVAATAESAPARAAEPPAEDAAVAVIAESAPARAAEPPAQEAPVVAAAESAPARATSIEPSPHEPDRAARHADHVSHRHRRPQRPVDGGTAADAGPQQGREPDPPATPRPHEHASHRHRRSHDPARAASHLHALDDGDEAAARYVAAAREASEAGHGAQGQSHAQQALAILERLPRSDARRRLWISALVELARVHWRTVGADANQTLETGLATARRAQAALQPEDPPALQAEVALVIAGIAYDSGDLRGLEEALAVLVAASEALMAAGDARGAAALLNDQAAVYIRLGDHVRATHLLTSSRQVFEDAGEQDPVARRELGETHHLLARVPLHAPIRPGRETDALSLALDHALVAEKLLRGLGDARAVARVWETMGRIEIAKRRLDRAGQRLGAALEVQRSLGDAIGMARTTAALADLLAENGQLRESLDLLAVSIGLNREKGSPFGLGLNRQALQRLRARVRTRDEADAFAAVEQGLAAAEALLGRHPLPEGVATGA